MSLVQRTSRYLQPSHERFEPLPAAAALLDPASAGQLLSLADREDLVEAAKAFIKDMSQSQLLEPTVPMNLAQGENDENQPSTSHDSAEDAEAAPPPVKRAKFRYLAQKVGNLPVPGPHTIDRELDEHLTAVRQGVNTPCRTAVKCSSRFWIQHSLSGRPRPANGPYWHHLLLTWCPCLHLRHPLRECLVYVLISPKEKGTEH